VRNHLSALLLLRTQASATDRGSGLSGSCRRKPTEQGGGTCTEFGNGPFLGNLGAVLGVVLGVVLGSLPAGGEFFLRAIGGAERTQTTDHGRPEGSKARTKDEEIWLDTA
jgi:hypothetical protein